jgi:SAM-dependent methyltransferase
VFDTYAEIFAERARSYHSAMEEMPLARQAELRAVLEPLDHLPAGRLCDLPAGGGYLAHHLKPGLVYVGVDPTGDFVALGSSGDVVIVKAELVDVPLASGSFDYVVSLAGLHHEPDLEAVFREMRRLLRDDGRLVIADVAEATPPARFLNGFVARTNPMGHNGRFLDEGTQSLLEEAGFSVLQDEIVTTPWIFEKFEEAGAFAARLFRTDEASGAEVAEALADEIGVERTGSEVHVNWCLRRIVCSAQ